MAKPKFVSGGSTYEFDYAELLPVETEDRPYQIIGRTETGKKKVGTLGDYSRAWLLEWVCVTDASLASLKTFIRSTVNFAGTAFQFTGSNSTGVTVRIMDSPVMYRQVGPTHYTGALNLEEEVS